MSRLEIPLLEGERWWGGAVADGQAMPFGRRPHHRDLATNAGFVDDPMDGANQSAPLLVSSRGRYVWSDAAFAFTVAQEALTVDGADAVCRTAGAGLRDAYRAAAAAHFPTSGATPAQELFTGPQYNTWIEMPFAPDQDQVLGYARSLLDSGFPPGVVMVDDRWSRDYGDWVFDRSRFPDPTALVDELHALGFTVMLWLVPYVSPDGDVFRYLESRRMLVRSADGETAVRRWWNGYSAVLDVTDPRAVQWLHDRLDTLRDEHGIDGFKFDGGDLRYVRADDLTAGGVDQAGHCEAWARIGLRYPFNEYRACWKNGGTPLAQRLHDKPPVWGAGGLASLIPEGIAQGLIGHAFTCPDMVGGGELTSFPQDGTVADQELFVRYAQCAALFPMMQFSASPVRVLDAEHLAAVRAAVDLRQRLVPEILALATESAASGEPMLRPLAYHHDGYDDVHDQFLLGPDLLVAPVLAPAAAHRRVLLPPGLWADDRGAVHRGPARLDVRVALDSLPWFRRSA